MFDNELSSGTSELADADGAVEAYLDAAAPGGQAWSECVPNGMLADLLAQLPATGEHVPADERHVVDFESLERIGAWERVVAWAQAAQAREIAGLVGRAQADPHSGATPTEAAESAVAEVGLMLRLAPRTAGQRVSQAVTLTGRLPATLAALESGRICLPHARVIDHETVHLTDEQAAAVEAAVVARAAAQTPAQLRAATRRAVLRVDPDAAARRHERERRDRHVRLDPDPDGMATFSAYLPAPDAGRIYAAVDEHARRAAAPHDDRGIDARRADALVDLVIDGTPTGPDTPADTGHSRDASQGAGPGCAGIAQPAGRPTDPAYTPRASTASAGSAGARAASRAAAQARVTVSLPTLLGLGSEPGELAGYGPITAQAARELAADATWQRLLTDPTTGALLDHGTTRYTPPPSLAQHVTTRDQTCRFPGCRVPAHRCDLDHGQPFDPQADASGTSPDNLTAKCRTHHRLKQLPGWTVTQHPDATVAWTTPSGHTYTTHPPPVDGTAPP